MLLTILLSAALIGLDQIAKFLAVQYLQPVGYAPFIPRIIEFRYVENNGAAFSMLAGKQALLITITSIALMVALYILLFRRPKKRLEYIAILLIFSGGVGNLIDRILNGYVVDFINLIFIRFAVFNLADIMVCVGFGLLFVSVIKDELQLKREMKSKADSAAGAEEVKTEEEPTEKQD